MLKCKGNNANDKCKDSNKNKAHPQKYIPPDFHNDPATENSSKNLNKTN